MRTYRVTYPAVTIEVEAENEEAARRAFFEEVPYLSASDEALLMEVEDLGEVTKEE